MSYCWTSRGGARVNTLGIYMVLFNTFPTVRLRPWFRA